MTELIGIIGGIFTLTAFILNQTHKLSNDDLIYDVMNAISGTLLVIYAYLIGSIPFLIINLVWAFFAYRDIIFKDKKRI